MLKQFAPGQQQKQRELDAEALRLRMEELSYSELAERLGVDQKTARARVRRAEERVLEELVHETAVAKQRTMMRLDRALRAAWERFEAEEDPDRKLKWHCQILKSLDLYRKLWGLGQSDGAGTQPPTVFAQQATITQIDPAITRALLGRDPIPLPGHAPAEAETPLRVEIDAPSEPPDRELRRDIKGVF
jgi:predicted DNA-binding protein (UPF0251 family)